MPQISDSELKKILTEEKIIDGKELEEVVKEAEKGEMKLGDLLVDKQLVTKESLAKVMAGFYKLPYVNLDKYRIASEVFDSILYDQAVENKMVVFARSAEVIKIATCQPPIKQNILDNIVKKTGLKVEVHFAGDDQIENILVKNRQDLQSTFEKLLKDGMVTVTTVSGGEDPPVEKIVNLLLDTAYNDKASDIHIEPQEKNAIVRFRVDGILREVLTIPKILFDRVITRIKVMSSLRTDEHLSAQDGKIKFHSGDDHFDIRVSIVPIVDGEKVVMRLLTSNLGNFSLVDLGMSPENVAKVEAAFSRSYGMILSTGPTGSGKTSTIYSILQVLNSPEKNITTVEDPVEYRIKGANQIQVNNRTNLSFANGLRSILRQDPNIIFVGEIRDSETAGIAVNASLTGHLVFSTMHTNTAVAAVARLIDMGIEPFLVASTVSVVIGQRLVRRICDKCRRSSLITFDKLLEYFPEDMINKHYMPVGKNKEIRIYHGKGCQYCHNTGYQGRVGIYEVLDVTKTVRQSISQRQDADKILELAKKEGFLTMLDDGLDKITKGLTTVEEVLRVTRNEAA